MLAREAVVPNIEIHGYGDNLKGLKESETCEQKVFGVFHDAPYKSDIVVTVVPDVTKEADGSLAPFFRVYYTALTPSDLTAKIDVLERLSTLGLDIEVIELVKFIPKKAVKKLASA